MSLDRRITALEGILSPSEPPAWTVWEQDRITADLFHCRRTGETACWDELAGRPATTIIEYTDTGRTMHLPGGVTRVLGVGRDEGDDTG